MGRAKNSILFYNTTIFVVALFIVCIQGYNLSKIKYVFNVDSFIRAKNIITSINFKSFNNKNQFKILSVIGTKEKEKKIYKKKKIVAVATTSARVIPASVIKHIKIKSKKIKKVTIEEFQIHYKKLNGAEINDNKIGKFTGYNFPLPETLDVSPILVKLANTFLDLKRIKLAKKEIEKNIKKIVPIVKVENVKKNIRKNFKISKETAPEDKKMVVDKVITQYAGNNKYNVEPQYIDDFVVFDYSKQKKVASTSTSNPLLVQEDEKISPYVSDVINRHMKDRNKFQTVIAGRFTPPSSSDITPQIEADIPIVAYSAPSSPTSHDHTQLPSDYPADDAKGYEKMTTQGVSSQNSSAQRSLKSSNIYLKVRNIDFGHGLSDYQRSFEFIPSYNIQDRMFDNGEGEILISSKILKSSSVLSGTIKQVGKLPVITDIVFEEGDFEVVIPVIGIDSFERFLNKHDLNFLGGFILVELDDSVENIDLDATSRGRIYLSSDFVKVNRERAAYVLIVGVKLGNTVLSYQIAGHTAQKIIHIVEDQIYFDSSNFIRGGVSRFQLFEDGLLSRGSKLLDVFGSEIKYFNYRTFAQKESLDEYTIKTPYIPLGTRNYLKISHLNDSMFIGYAENKKIDLPNQDFINYIFDTFRIDSLGNGCIIQLNLSNNVETFDYSAYSHLRQLGTEIIYLDEDGGIYDEISQMTKKIFIFGDSSGVMSLKLKYLNGAEEYLQTMCPEKSYLVEQL